MKKIVLILAVFLLVTNVGFCADKYSKDYLQNRKHFAIMNPLLESMVEHGIKSSLRKETGGKFKVKFEGYTASSMKKGIFKNIELAGNNVNVNNITLPYVHVKSLSDYNYINYSADPIEFKSDMEFTYDLELSQDTLNSALAQNDYQKVLKHVNSLAYPMFEIKAVRTKIANNRVYVLADYNFPLIPSNKDRTFVSSTKFEVDNGNIKAVDIKLDSAYGNISAHKVANLLNLLNPLGFTLKLVDSKNCKTKIENVNIIDNKIQVNGKIFVKGD